MLNINTSSRTSDFLFPGPYPSRRSDVRGQQGMVATSQPLAAAAGLKMLFNGGNAVDAAVSAALTLTVVDPRSTHLGGDAFALVAHPNGAVEGLNASGRSPSELTAEAVSSAGYTTSMPQDGPLAITVPGQLDGFETLLSKHGRFDLETVLQPAIEYARNGFPVSEEVSSRWAGEVSKLKRYEEGKSPFLVDGKSPAPGQHIAFPAYANTLEAIAKYGIQHFYDGPLGIEFCEDLQRQGSLLSMDDLRAHRSDWVEPESVEYRGRLVHELPPNTQGILPLIALRALEEYDLSQLDYSEQLHLQIEAMKLALDIGVPLIYDDAAGREFLNVLNSVQRNAGGLLLDGTNAVQRDLVFPPGSDTVFIAAADDSGMMVSLITSTYDGFGSGVVSERSGVVGQNRAANFSLEPDSPNFVGPSKRPYHTIIPCIVTDREGPLMSMGVVGAMMQPQGQVQLLSGILDRGLSPQQALDAPRFRVEPDGRVGLEPGLAEFNDRLSNRKHNTRLISGSQRFGGAQIILRDGDHLLGGSDGRKDGGVYAF